MRLLLYPATKMLPQGSLPMPRGPLLLKFVFACGQPSPLESVLPEQTVPLPAAKVTTPEWTSILRTARFEVSITQTLPRGSTVRPPRISALKATEVPVHPSPNASVAVREESAVQGEPLVTLARPPARVVMVLGRARGACCASIATAGTTVKARNAHTKRTKEFLKPIQLPQK